MGPISRGGYAFVRRPTSEGRKLGYAHRWIFEVAVGALSNGLTIDHRCRVRCCVNPLHLDAVSIQENIARGRHARRLEQHAQTLHELAGKRTEPRRRSLIVELDFMTAKAACSAANRQDLTLEEFIKSAIDERIKRYG